MYLHYLVEGHWKYCRETLTGEELLFNLEEDPREELNLINRSGSDLDVIAKFRETMNDHLAAHPVLNQKSQDPGVLKGVEHLPCNVHPGMRGR